MARSKSTHATTLSISLPPELAAAVHERVRSGLYGSASELLREALRRFLFAPDGWSRVDRVAEAIEPWGGAGKLAEPPPPESAADPIEQQRRLRLQRALDELETDAVIRPAPERLRRLRDANQT